MARHMKNCRLLDGFQQRLYGDPGTRVYSAVFFGGKIDTISLRNNSTDPIHFSYRSSQGLTGFRVGYGC
ncbi:hypothetical protein PHLCEN_2v8468 [Hermanssonia centrifuga]|uniref:Uncharacterized protein n=1 Tax=Hermanssonia centrifuga TaxID=98765 RepID=A0A2R6NTM5_9APHY|nr:hypothetical protein PHLCEN_2v8468 [Hermanssonia centrifuga]